MTHDFKRFPELTNSQMDLYYFSSPHKQIFEDFRAQVTKVTDGDTINVKWAERDFDFPIRFKGINAKEMSEGGEPTKEWLKTLIEDKEVDILIDKKNRVGKYGRLIGNVVFNGMSLSDWMLREGRVTSFDNRMEGKLPNIDKDLAVDKWL